MKADQFSKIFSFELNHSKNLFFLFVKLRLSKWWGFGFCKFYDLTLNLYGKELKDADLSKSASPHRKLNGNCESK